MTTDPDDLLLRAAARRLARDAVGKCPDPAIWVDYFGGRLDEPRAEALREHLAACADCVEAVRDARRFLAALARAERAAAAAPAPPRGWRPLVPVFGRLAAALLLATGVVWLFVARRTTSGGLEVAKAIYSPQPADESPLLYRDAEGVDPEVEASFAAAMRGYQRDDFERAARDLAAHLDRHPQDQRARFYRGVSLLLLGRARAAEPELRRVAALASPRLAGEARWYRALALLRLGDHGQARAELETLASGSGPRRDAAARLLAATGADPAP